MFRKLFSILMISILVCPAFSHNAYATGGQEVAASFFLPTTGQAMNGELGNGKTKLMAGVEVASIAAIAVLGIATGGAPELPASVGAIGRSEFRRPDDSHQALAGRQNGCPRQL